METERCSICSLSQAKFSCSCALLSLPICETCLLSHLSTAGSHITVPLRPRVTATSETGNEVCDECGNRQADYFCLCSSSLRKFCRGCDYSHYQKAPHMVHFKHPMAGYQEVASGRMSIEAFHKKQFHINSLLLHLEEELSSFDAFVKSTEAEFLAVQEQIAAQKAEFLGDMQVQRVNLISAIGEVYQYIESKRYIETLEVVSYLDDSIVNGYLCPWLCDMRLFIGKTNIQPVLRALEELVEYELAGILLEKAEALPAFERNALALYTLPNLEKTYISIDKTVKIDNETAFCYIEKSTLLCCGGANSNLIYEADLQSGEIMYVASMSVVKGCVGIWNYQGQTVLIFGGHNMKMKYNTWEQYTISNKQLTTSFKPMLRAKTYCSVCEHSTGLYISGNNGTQQSIELFNPWSRTYVLLYECAQLISTMLAVWKTTSTMLQGKAFGLPVFLRGRRELPLQSKRPSQVQVVGI